jgi:predicted RNA-binding Zn-ribbon protein involved in translation (DUF1610 family)
MGLGMQSLVCPRCGNEFFVLPVHDIPLLEGCGWGQFGCPHCGEVFFFRDSRDKLSSKLAKPAHIWHENRACQSTPAARSAGLPLASKSPCKASLWRRVVTWFSKD